MIMGDTDSCSSRAVGFPLTMNRNHRLKVDIYNKVLRRLKYLNVAESNLPGFEDNVWSHFLRLPTRYALDINVERAQDVLVHQRLLQMAHNQAARPAIEVRLVQVRSASDPNSKKNVEATCSNYSSKQSIHHPPAFGLSPDIELALEANHLCIQDWDSNKKSKQVYPWAMHEITISTIDKPKLLSQLTSLMSEIGLNIQEAHAYSTSDGYSLDVFVVDGWETEGTEQLRDTLAKEIQNFEVNYHVKSPVQEQNPVMKFVSNQVSLPADGNGIWEIDTSMLKYERKIACGSSGDLYKGTLHNKDVAIKVLRAEHLNEMVQREFDQEVYMMRKLQHKNVVKFLGACTRPPNLCIVTEFMSDGSMYDFLRQNGAMPLQSLVRVAIDITEGMNYLHQNNIIHRDLKAANLLINQHGVVKVSDFGVARVQDQSGVMTSETGTYRWMAPEVIEHKPYDQKADIFSFGIVLWELLTGKLPYENLTPLQAAVGVIQKGLRPTIPKHTHPMLVALIERCWHQDPSSRPEFSEILEILENVASRLHTGERTSRRRIRQE